MSRLTGISVVSNFSLQLGFDLLLFLSFHFCLWCPYDSWVVDRCVLYPSVRAAILFLFWERFWFGCDPLSNVVWLWRFPLACSILGSEGILLAFPSLLFSFLRLDSLMQVLPVAAPFKVWSLDLVHWNSACPYLPCSPSICIHLAIKEWEHSE